MEQQLMTKPRVFPCSGRLGCGGTFTVMPGIPMVVYHGDNPEAARQFTVVEIVYGPGPDTEFMCWIDEVHQYQSITQTTPPDPPHP